MRDYEQDVEKFDLSYFCPKCKQQVRGEPLTDACYGGSGSISEQYAHLICQCPTKYCGLAFIIYDRLNYRISRVFPYPHTEAEDFHSSIPEKIREDYAEAKRCYYADAYRGMVVMCRRVIQQVVVNKISDQIVWKKKLHEQIQELFDRRLITRSLNDALHEVRHFGNFGAHPRDDGLDDISQEDAETIRALTWDLLVDLYIRPFETAKMTEKRKSTNEK